MFRAPVRTVIGCLLATTAPSAGALAQSQVPPPTGGAITETPQTDITQQGGPTQPNTVPATGDGRSSQLEEIVVTARRRAESLQDTPIAVTAFSSVAIDRKFATDIRALAGEVPNVVITNVPGFKRGFDRNTWAIDRRYHPHL